VSALDPAWWSGGHSTSKPLRTAEAPLRRVVALRDTPGAREKVLNLSCGHVLRRPRSAAYRRRARCVTCGEADRKKRLERLA
jgi:hypothetical protein